VLWTFQRSRRLVSGVISLVVFAAAGVVGAWLSSGESTVVRLVALHPVVVGAVAGLASVSDVAEIEGSSPRPIEAISAAVVVALIFLGSAVSLAAVATVVSIVPAGLPFSPAWAFWMSVGAGGLGILGARLFGRSLAWVVPAGLYVPMLVTGVLRPVAEAETLGFEGTAVRFDAIPAVVAGAVALLVLGVASRWGGRRWRRGEPTSRSGPW